MKQRFRRNLTYLAFHVWNECPRILKVDISALKSGILWEKLAFVLVTLLKLTIDHHSKRERLTMVKLHLKNVFARCRLFTSLPIRQIIAIFRSNSHVTCHVT